jgi:hypothetical protein
MQRLPSPLFTVVALWATLPCVLAEAPLTPSEGKVHLQNMSSVERDRFNRNVEMFQALNGDQKTQFRHLHDELTKDRLRGGVLINLLECYSQWLHTLSPVQREQLQQETDPGRKVALVRQFMDEQDRQLKEEHDRILKEEREEVRTIGDAAVQESASNMRQLNPFKILQLDRRDLEAVMKVIYDELPADKKIADFESISIYQYPSIVGESVKLKSDFATWPDPAMLKKMGGKLPQRKVKIISSLTKFGVPERETAVRLLLGGIMKHVQDAIVKPTEEDRLTALNGLKAAEKKTYESLSEEKRTAYLNHKFLEKSGNESYGNSLNCRRELYDLFSQLKVEPPPGFTRPAAKRDSAAQSKS